MRTLTITNTGSHASVRTHETTVHTGGAALAVAVPYQRFPLWSLRLQQVRRPELTTRDKETLSTDAVFTPRSWAIPWLQFAPHLTNGCHFLPSWGTAGECCNSSDSMSCQQKESKSVFSDYSRLNPHCVWLSSSCIRAFVRVCHGVCMPGEYAWCMCACS